MTISRGFKRTLNQDTLDVWLIRDGLDIVYDHKVKEVSEILHELGWRTEGKTSESLAFEDKIGFFLHRASKHMEGSLYDFTEATEDFQEELSLLVEDMDAVVTALGYEITFGELNYVINKAS
jgi:hypothetical protein